mmetsp:Transcript_9640/g.14868  ORF Transcript_9640/g.14868 Transcript_9640/m.14868 type:complete len:706 (+) Transcript_9640:238-2355(+)|eukprot:CAMPEP_0178932770 /NCGR_PEP_ID=MMETSP0786-20121207/22838_1 /TAXON_ID=186022 /ORGANISM="Thalassionema frauenfeldii, Strain CCMP 1798" /LENGTH=705 /DNA_ID=CAMNT_0020610171 /DNA_START=27 /DNA_END=2144 /DNA_ORIENTATION=+
MNPDLRNERAKATFSVERLTNMLDGGAERTKRRRQIEEIIERDPTGIFSNDENIYLHRTDRHKRSLAKHVRMIEICRKLGIGDECGGEIIRSKDFPLMWKAIADDLPTALHWVMFVPNIISLCDEQQQAQWLPLCRDWKMIGCYAQTEIGHGSNVRALETTATFLAENQGGDKGGSWIINSPTLTSTKAWPGTLGRTANHAMVIARLIDGEGIDQGIHNFLVPLRSMKDHKLLPGVKTGDLGPKIGYNTMDNGFASFDHVKIPRRNMAMRFATVDENGKYLKKSVSDATSKISYITMMQVRAYIVDEAGKNLGMATTITTRYSAVRRQGYSADGKKEFQILDYKQQQHRILPLIAASYCFFFTGKKVLERLQKIENQLISGVGTVTKTQVADIHASTSSLKSFTTTIAADGIEECRKACGGHGFLQCSGLPELFTSYLQNPTVEGDNQMLPQQVAKVLLKLVQAVKDGHDLSSYDNCDASLLIPSLQSILRKKVEKCSATSAEDLMDVGILIKSFGHRAARLLVGVAHDMNRCISSGASMEEAWNESLIQMARMSRGYSMLVLLTEVAKGIEDEFERGALQEAEVLVLKDLARLFALSQMEKNMGDFLEDGFMSAKKASWVRWNVIKLLSKIRPNAVALVDAFDHSDFRLKSVLGRFDGDVYSHLLKTSKKDPLNATEPGPGYEPHLRRLIRDGAGVYTGTSSRL